MRFPDVKTITLLTLTAFALALTACEKKTSDRIKDDARDAKEAAKEAVKDAKEAAKDAKEEAKDKSSPTRLKIRGTWDETKGRLKQKFAQLTDDDLLYTEGKEEELYGRLEKKLGKNREEVQKLLEE